MHSKRIINQAYFVHKTQKKRSFNYLIFVLCEQANVILFLLIFFFSLTFTVGHFFQKSMSILFMFENNVLQLFLESLLVFSLQFYHYLLFLPLHNADKYHIFFFHFDSNFFNSLPHKAINRKSYILASSSHMCKMQGNICLKKRSSVGVTYTRPTAFTSLFFVQYENDKKNTQLSSLLAMSD